MKNATSTETRAELERLAMRWTFHFPNKQWLWGFQKHATYICFHFGRIEGLICWRGK